MRFQRHCLRAVVPANASSGPWVWGLGFEMRSTQASRQSGLPCDWSADAMAPPCSLPVDSFPWPPRRPPSTRHPPHRALSGPRLAKCMPIKKLVSRHGSSVGLRWPSKRIAALHRLPIRSVLAARSLRHLIGDATLARHGNAVKHGDRPEAAIAMVAGLGVPSSAAGPRPCWLPSP